MKKRNIAFGAVLAICTVITVLPTGNSAAAEPAAGSSTPYDFSDDAKADFLAWWKYEQSYSMPSGLPDEEAYLKGFTVCGNVWRGVALSDIENWLEQRVGENGTNAAALIAAALRSLCPSLNLTSGQAVDCSNFAGYLTYFDKQVRIWHPQFMRETVFGPAAWIPDLCQFGQLGQFVCRQLELPNGSANLHDTLISHPEYSKTIGLYHVDDYKRLVRYVAEAACPAIAQRLGPWWSLPGS